MTVVLWHIELSHYNEKVRWALDYKDIPHERRVPMPGLHGVRAAVLTRGAQRRLPVIDLDGRRIGDSTAIIAALEQYQPEPPLYPDDPAELRPRARARGLVRRAARRRRCGGSGGSTRCRTRTRPPRRCSRAAIPARERLLRLTAPVSRRVGERRLRGQRGERRGRARDDPRGDGPASRPSCSRPATSSVTASASRTSPGASLFTPLLAPAGAPVRAGARCPRCRSSTTSSRRGPAGSGSTEMYARHRGAWVPA